MQRIMPWFWNSDWDQASIILAVNILGDKITIKQSISNLKIVVKQYAGSGIILKESDFKHNLGKSIELDLSFLQPLKASNPHSFARSLHIFCKPDQVENVVDISIHYHSKAILKGSMDAVAKDILSRMQIEYVQ